MANYYNPNGYSLIDIPEFKTAYSNSVQPEQKKPEESLISPEVARATAYGAQSGGISGGLIAGGLTSSLAPGGLAGAGPYAVAGGLILSQIEAAQKAKLEQEQERIANEKNRQAKLDNVYQRMGSMRFGV